MVSRNAISVELGFQLKRQLEKYNFDHRDSKIKYTEVCRLALSKELEQRQINL